MFVSRTRAGKYVDSLLSHSLQAKPNFYFLLLLPGKKYKKMVANW